MGDRVVGVPGEGAGQERTQQAGEPALRATGLTKSFGPVTVLRDVSIAVDSGEIRALVGRNGSGKSTLVKILAGYHDPDPGSQLEIGVRAVSFPMSSADSQRYGLSFVHQDLGLIPEMSVVDNLLIGRFAGRRGRIPWKRERARAREALSRLGVDVDPEAPVQSLRQVERALLAVARGLLRMPDGGGVLVLDEPTAFLPADDVDRLFGAVREVRAGGAAVIYVSHRLAEVLDLADTVTVLRDGAHVITRPVSGLSKDDLIEQILGQRLETFYPAVRAAGGDVLLAAEHLEGRTVRDLSLSLHAGEILGVTGINGAGYDELPYLLYGDPPATRGTIRIRGEEMKAASMTPRRAIGYRVALLPADRQTSSGAQDMSVLHNVSLPVVHRFYRHGLLQHREERQKMYELIDEHTVTPPDVGLILRQLSGGNQQKALLAKWLQVEPEILLLHEPTQGVDVGSKQQIFSRIEAVAERGTGVVIASGEYGDLANLCHRVVVLRDGYVVSTLHRSELTEDRIADQAFRADLDQFEPAQLQAREGELDVTRP
jgi:ribose transport system ATP-binding protein